MKSVFLFHRWLALAAILLSASISLAQDAPAKKPAPEIELCICLDISGSMQGLIGSAKTRLWDIVNELGRAQPTPSLKVALYSYGSPKYGKESGYVRKETDFTADLDLVNQKLFGLTINGGDEYVARVCRAAMLEQKWSEDPKTLKIIFVCGNEPATQDPMYTTKEVAEMAAKKGIIINTIYCGNEAKAEATGWRDFALLAEGRFASIDMNRGVVAIQTPFDKKLAELSGKIGKTYAFAGKEGRALAENQRAQDANAAQQAPAAAAARGVSKANGIYRFEQDLVQKLQDDAKFDVKKVPDADLSDELKAMTPEARETHVKTLLAERETLQKEIRELGQQREAFIREQERKQAAPGQQTLEHALRGIIREQGKRKSIVIPE